MAAVATVASDGLLLTANQGDTNDRDKKRDPKNKSAIHPRILQRTGT